MTQEKLLQDFAGYLRSEGYSRTTGHGYCNQVRRFLSWLSGERIRYTEASYTDLLAYVRFLREDGKKGSTVNGIMNAVRHFYNYLQGSGQTAHNPAETLRVRNIIRRVPHDLLTWDELERLYHDYPASGVTGRRNKAVIGLLVYQGLTTAELTALEVTDVNLMEGRIYIPVTGRSNSRTLKLEAFHVLQLQKYITRVRSVILAMAGKESDRLFISTGKGVRMSNSYVYMQRVLKKLNPKARDMRQIRASVITHWLEHYHIRQVQYMAGHRYISSTEYYRTVHLDGLQEQVDELHPLG
ncbi:MAG: tyrosine-type recombinase/integrase [Bacteroidetes bacterium]|nr:tyrosine-type recombinase/integrase [Bacteroidota bacterium]